MMLVHSGCPIYTFSVCSCEVASKAIQHTLGLKTFAVKIITVKSQTLSGPGL